MCFDLLRKAKGSCTQSTLRPRVTCLAGPSALLGSEKQRRGGETPPLRVLSGCSIFRPLPEGAGFCEAKDWGSVVLKEYTPSAFGYAESTSLREGGKWIAGGDVILQGKMTGRGHPSPTNSIRVRCKEEVGCALPGHLSFFLVYKVGTVLGTKKERLGSPFLFYSYASFSPRRSIPKWAGKWKLGVGFSTGFQAK